MLRNLLQDKKMKVGAGGDCPSEITFAFSF